MSNSLFGQGYDPKESTGAKALPAGGYVCRIMNAKIENAKSSGLPMVVIQFDICEGEYNNFFHDKLKADMAYRPDAKYGGIARISAIDEEGKQRKGFNSFCGAVEKSNGIKLPTEDTAFLNMLKGKMVGIIFGREEFQGNDGGMYWSTKPQFYRSVETIESGNFEIPKDKFVEPKPTAPLESGVRDLFGDVPLSTVDSFNAAADDIPFN